MNVHPLLVHYPIAFFMTYGVFELLRFKRLMQQPYWFYIKAILVCLGVISAVPTAIAGKVIQPQFSDTTLVSMHEHVNEAAIGIFTILAFAYIIAWLQKSTSHFWNFPNKVEHFILHTPLLYVFVIPGLLLISLGGLLGGIIVYGPNLDPFTIVVYSFLVSQGLLK